MGHQQANQYTYYRHPRWRREQEKGTESLFEKIVYENFLNLRKEADIQMQEAQRMPNKRNPERLTVSYIIVKLSNIKDKKRVLKETEGKQSVSYKATPDKTLGRFF